MRPSRVIVAALPLTLACALAHASELRVQGGLWDYTVSGFEEDHGNHTDLDSDLGVGKQKDGFIQLEYEHRPSWLPDIGASYTQLSDEGSQTTSGVGGSLPLPLPPPVGSTTLTAKGDFDDVDASLRYAIALGPLQVSPGITVKWLHGDVVTHDSSSGTDTTQRYTQVFPMVHAQIAWPIGKYLRLSAQGDWISYQDDEAHEFSAAAEFRFLGPLGVYGGWQQKRYKVRDSNAALDARLQGFRVGATVVF